MKKWSNLILAFVFLSSVISNSAQAANAVPTEVMEAKDSVVRIITEYTSAFSSGSGFVIQSDNEKTLIATNYHVVEGNALNISVLLGNNETIAARIVAYSDQKDLCILELAYTISMKELMLSKNAVSQGDPVYAVGFPSAADNFSDSIAQSSQEATITDGIVSAMRQVTITQYGSLVNILQINADINPGNSGGPLFNNKGAVIGINTYGILDSQGINGAIDIDELITLLNDNDIYYASVQKELRDSLIAIIVILSIMGVSVLLFVLKKNGSFGNFKNLLRKHKKGNTLRVYMEKYPNGIKINEAVSLLMPIALQIKNFHNNGKLHLQISPDLIIINNGTSNLTAPTSFENNMYSSGFASPEVYRHKGISAPSDIYSFCAILLYVVSGKIPENALNLEDYTSIFIPESIKNDDFVSIIKKGLAMKSDDRYLDISELIKRLLPFSTKQNVMKSNDSGEDIQDSPIVNDKIEACLDNNLGNTSGLALDASKNLPSKRKKTVIVTLACISSFIVLICGLYCATYKVATGKATEGEFEIANKYLILPFITSLHDPYLIEYVNAGLLLYDRQFSKAEEAFASLDQYLNSEQWVKESKYRHAAQLTDTDLFDEAIGIYKELQGINYKDSGDMLLNTQYRKGVYTLYELQDYENASEIFTALRNKKYSKADEMYLETYYVWGNSLANEEDYLGAFDKLSICSGYNDSKELLNALKTTIYEIGVNDYRNGDYINAGAYFTKVSKYSNVNNYLILIKMHQKTSHTEFDISTLTSLIGFEDASSLIFKSNGELFFNGTFSCSSGYVKLYKDNKGDWRGQWTLPGIPSGTWHFDNGTFYTSNRARFDIYATSANSIVVYVISSGKTYTLTRG